MTRKRHRTPKFDHEAIKRAVIARPDARLKEIAAEFGCGITVVSLIRKKLKRKFIDETKQQE